MNESAASHTIENPWEGRYKIPWDEPEFSKRMLREHLTQDHDMASRSEEWIIRQVEWIHTSACGGRARRILDLGCGPGLYVHRLCKLGHECVGIDFGPASIDYARHHADAERSKFIQGDLRATEIEGTFDLAMMLFGELNTFSPEEIAAILGRVRRNLESGSPLIVEIQTVEAVMSGGKADPTEVELDSGLFCEHPHRWRTTNHWLEDHRVGVQVFDITDKQSGQTTQYRSTSRAWSDDELADLFRSAGFSRPEPCPDWPCNTESLTLRKAQAV